MIYEFTLNEKDYLTHQLFVFSNSKPAIKRRKKGWFLTVGFFLFLGLILFYLENQFLGIYFFVAAVLSLIFYPLYTKWRYKKHYLRHIRETYGSRLDQKAFIEFTGEHIIACDGENSESKLHYSLIEAIHHLKEHFLIRLKGGQTLILPIYKIQDYNQLEHELYKIADSIELSILNNKNWEWK